MLTTTESTKASTRFATKGNPFLIFQINQRSLRGGEGESSRGKGIEGRGGGGELRGLKGRVKEKAYTHSHVLT